MGTVSVRKSVLVTVRAHPLPTRMKARNKHSNAPKGFFIVRLIPDFYQNAADL